MKTRAVVLAVMALALTASARAEMSRDEVAAMAQRSVGGRVLSIGRPPGASSSGEWRVKMLSAQGEVRVIGIDPATGRMAGPDAAQTSGACADARTCRPARP
jgi:hypothetical protein